MSTELTELPFAWAVATGKLEHICSFCLHGSSPDTKLLRCGRCKSMRYCSAECQRSDWSDHKSECIAIEAAYRQNPSFVLPDDGARLIFRVWHKVRREVAANKPHVSGGRSFGDLVSHDEEIRNSQHAWTAFREFYRDKLLPLFEFSNASCPSEMDVLDIYGRVMVNAFGIKNAELQSIGIGLYLNLCRLDHSCDPNARIVYRGREAVVVPVKRATWTSDELDATKFHYENIFHSYIENVMLASERRAQLKRDYFFDCTCDGCANGEREAEMEALVCTATRGCTGAVLEGRNFECSRCGLQLEEVGTAQMALVASKSALEKLATLGEKVDPAQTFALCTKLLSLTEDVLGRRNVVRAQLLRMVYEACVRMSRWDDAKVYGGQLVDIQRFYYAKLDPWFGALLKNFGKVCLNAKDPKRAKGVFEEARVILVHAFGEDSEVAREIDAILSRCC